MTLETAKVFAYFFLKLHLHHFLKDKTHNEVTKQQESRFYLLFLLDDGRIRIRIPEAQKHTDPMDPDRNTGSETLQNESLKVHKREKFFSSDFEFFTILYLVKFKY